MSFEPIHRIFYISLLKKFVGDNSFLGAIENMGVKDFLTYEEVSIQIIDFHFQKLSTKDKASIKSVEEESKGQGIYLRIK